MSESQLAKKRSTTTVVQTTSLSSKAPRQRLKQLKRKRTTRRKQTKQTLYLQAFLVLKQKKTIVRATVMIRNLPRSKRKQPQLNQQYRQEI